MRSAHDMIRFVIGPHEQMGLISAYPGWKREGGPRQPEFFSLEIDLPGAVAHRLQVSTERACPIGARQKVFVATLVEEVAVHLWADRERSHNARLLLALGFSDAGPSPGRGNPDPLVPPQVRGDPLTGVKERKTEQKDEAKQVGKFGEGERLVVDHEDGGGSEHKPTDGGKAGEIEERGAGALAMGRGVRALGACVPLVLWRSSIITMAPFVDGNYFTLAVPFLLLFRLGAVAANI